MKHDKDRMDGGMNSETATLAEQSGKHPYEEPTEETIVKTEIIILPDGLLPTLRCRLCDSPDHLCSPMYNLRGGIELTEKHLETIYRLSDITINYDQDHASVVCSYCLLKIEEFSVIREVWQMKNKTEHKSNDVPAIKPAKLISYTDDKTMKNASTQCIDYEIVHKAPDVRDASTCTVRCEFAQTPVPSPEHNTSVPDDGDKNNGTQCETIDVEQYYKHLKRKRKKRRSKDALINEVMDLVKRQYRFKSDVVTNR